MGRSRVRKKAQVKKNATKRENIERNKRIKKLEEWYKELDQYENQAIANLIDRAETEEQDEAVSRPAGEDSEGGGGQGGSDGDGNSEPVR